MVESDRNETVATRRRASEYMLRVQQCVGRRASTGRRDGERGRTRGKEDGVSKWTAHQASLSEKGASPAREGSRKRITVRQLPRAGGILVYIRRSARPRCGALDTLKGVLPYVEEGGARQQ